MNFETFLLILKKNFNIEILAYSDYIEIKYNNIIYKFTYTGERVECNNRLYDLSDNVSEITIIDYFVSIVKQKELVESQIVIMTKILDVKNEAI